MTAAAAMKPAVALAVVAVASAILRRLRLPAGDERRQPAGIVAALLRLMLLRLVLLWLRLVLLRLKLRLLRRLVLLVLRPVELRLTAVRLLPAIGLLLLRLLLRLEVGLLAAEVLLRLLPALAGVAAVLGNALGARISWRGLRLVVRILLTELLLRRRDQAQIVLGVLVMGFGGDVVAARGRVACELKIFLGDVVRGAADLNVRAVRLVYACEWIVMMATIVVVMAPAAVVAVAPPHAFILTVSHHGSPVRRLPVAAAFGRRCFQSHSRAQPNCCASHNKGGHVPAAAVPVPRMRVA
jgi:hypothetical protein